MTKAAPEISQAQAFRTVRDRLAEAAAARKCHGCGCLHETVVALERTEAGRTHIADVLSLARSVFVPREYDCLGCPVCYPAIAANAFTVAFPESESPLDSCPTEPPSPRPGWPPLPGDYLVTRYRAPVAVCTLNSDHLAKDLAALRPDGLAIVGTLHTENLGIERIILNVLANPHLRYLVLCGQDTQQAIGHLPGQTMVSLFANGFDERGRIVGARGKRPFLKNVGRGQVDVFLRQVELVPLIGEEDPDAIAREVTRYAATAPGPFEGDAVEVAVTTIEAHEPTRLIPDPAGYFVVYPDPARDRLFVEHYTNDGILDCTLEGATPAAIYATAIERGLVTRLDHAAYLGRELARAEQSLQMGLPYTQDRAAGELVAPVSVASRPTAAAEVRACEKEAGCCSSGC